VRRSTRTFLILLPVCALVAWPPYVLGASRMPWPVVSWLIGPLLALALGRARERRATVDRRYVARPGARPN
jgi:hypothetical protein